MKAHQPAMEQLVARINEHCQSGQLDIPLLPEVAGQVVRLSQDADSDAGALARLIQRDPALAAHVMRIANSALYTPNVKMVSLQQAIARLGMRTITEIALAASISSSMFEAPGYEQYIETILSRSLTTGLWAKEVARVCRKNVEAAFLAGLLHDIGRPVLIHSAQQEAKTLDISLTVEQMYRLEQQLQHAVGLRVLQLWDMPQTVIQVVSHFHHYQTPHEDQLQTAIVVAGATIARAFAERNSEAEALQQLQGDEVFAQANLYPDEVEALLARAPQVEEAAAAMGV